MGVLLHHETAPQPGYVELFHDGSVRAGDYPDTTQTYPSADMAYAHYKAACFKRTVSGPWGILLALEDYLTQRDDGR